MTAALSAPDFPTDPSLFNSDDRISFSRRDNRYIAVDDRDGTEFRFDEPAALWILLEEEDDQEEEEWEAQMRGDLGKDDDARGSDAAAARSRKRKGGPSGGIEEQSSNRDGDGNNQTRSTKKKTKGGGTAIGTSNADDAADKGSGGRNPAPPPPPKKNTAVYVTGLPHDATVEEIHELFSRKAGVIAEADDSDEPRIKLYRDGAGNFKGDALIVFFKPPSVDIAIMLLDEAEFRLGSGEKMTVQPAEMSYKRVTAAAAAPSAEGGGGGEETPIGREAAESKPRLPPQKSEKDRQRIKAKRQKIDAKLGDWSDDENGLGGIIGGGRGGGPGGGGRGGKRGGREKDAGRWDRVVILKNMFTLAELEEDPAALLDIKADVREECEKLGPVTNVVLFDAEPDGVISVKFADPEPAQECVKLMHGRTFGGQIVQAAISTGRERYKRSRGGGDEGGGDEGGDDGAGD